VLPTDDPAEQQSRPSLKSVAQAYPGWPTMASEPARSSDQVADDLERTEMPVACGDENDGRPWTEFQTQTLIYASEALGMSDADLARFVGRSPLAVAHRTDELLKEGKLLRTEHGSRARRSWNELRPVIRALYEERVPKGTIQLFLGVSPRELETQLRGLFSEGMPRR
jgi:hypothetical protein